METDSAERIKDKLLKVAAKAETWTKANGKRAIPAVDHIHENPPEWLFLLRQDAITAMRQMDVSYIAGASREKNQSRHVRFKGI